MSEQSILTPQDIAALKQEILSSFHCSMPGIVESFDPLTQTVSARPALKRGSFLLPVIHDIPVFFPGSRLSGITWPIAEGDECLLVFADFDIDCWYASGEAKEPDSSRLHALPDAFAFVGFRSRLNSLPDLPAGASFFGIDPAPAMHDHDDRYYTETEVSSMLSGKSDTGHKHAAGDITSGVLTLVRGGSGQSATGETAVIADIATAESGCSITTAQYAWWGKVAMVRLIVKKTAAVTSGTTTLCTLASGKRPKYEASAQLLWGSGARILSSGKVQVNGAISAGASLTVEATYILA